MTMSSLLRIYNFKRAKRTQIELTCATLAAWYDLTVVWYTLFSLPR